MVIIEYQGKKYDVQIEDISDFLKLRKMCSNHGGKNIDNKGKHFVFTTKSDIVFQYIQAHLEPQRPPEPKSDPNKSAQMDFLESLTAPVMDDELAAFETPDMKREDRELAKESAHAIEAEKREGKIIHKKPEKKIADRYYEISVNDAVQVFMEDLYKLMEKHCRILIDVSNSDVKMKDFNEKSYNDFFGLVVKSMIDKGFINTDIASVLPVEYRYEKKIIDKIKNVIKSHTYSGGVGKSQIRIKIGKNHKRYMNMVNDILDYLVYTKEIKHDNHRYLLRIQSNFGGNEQPKGYVKVGRPKKTKEIMDIKVKNAPSEFKKRGI